MTNFVKKLKFWFWRTFSVRMMISLIGLRYGLKMAFLRFEWNLYLFGLKFKAFGRILKLFELKFKENEC